MPDLDDHLLAIATGDTQAFGSWVKGADRRLRLSLSRFAESVDVEAVVQETLLRIWQVAPRHPHGRIEDHPAWRTTWTRPAGERPSQRPSPCAVSRRRTTRRA